MLPQSFTSFFLENIINNILSSSKEKKEEKKKSLTAKCKWAWKLLQC